MPSIKVIRDEMRATSDDWYPCYPGNQVRVRVVRCLNGKWSVSVWGADDFGMDIDSDTQEEALSIYEGLQPVISITYLKCLGFNRF